MSKKRVNDVTLFSNGIGHFRRSYTVPALGKADISIPFKRDNIGDVAASLQVFGPVRLNTPPSFTPMNANATALRIDQKDTFRSLLQNLSGASVTLKTTLQGTHKYTLLGTETDSVSVNGEVAERHYVVVMAGGQVKRIPFTDVADIHFDEEGVRTEIEKALKNNFQSIKPDSTLLDLSLSATGDQEAEATVQYTIPVAAWKMRYAIRQETDKQDKEKIRYWLEGAAIIDNNTDEDWDNFQVSVVTGNPISFSTDIANVVVPHRKFLNLVDANSQANVDVQEGYSYSAPRGGMEFAAAPASAGRARSMSNIKMSTATSSTAQYSNVGIQGSTPDGMEYLDDDSLAESAGVDSKEVGDFCVFTSKEPITILARKSAVVPMFSVPLNKAGIVLLYREVSNARRPFRAVKFKNETEYSLGKGKTYIYNDGVFSGECVLDITKPGENRMLPHCVENGVRIVKESSAPESRRSSIRISDGVAVHEEVHTCVTKYVVENKKDEPYSVALEHSNALTARGHQNVLADFDGVTISDREKLVTGDGYRVYFKLAPKESVTLVATETSVHQQHAVLGSYFGWVKTHIIDVRNPLAQNSQVLAAVAVQKEIDEVSASIDNAKSRRGELVGQASRVRENLVASKDVTNSSLVAEWVKDLDSTEKEIRSIDGKEMPELSKRQKQLQSKMASVLSEMTVSWRDQ